jgi:hypothetical protein
MGTGGLLYFFGVVWIIGVVLSPETYGLVLLRERARMLEKTSGKK